MTLTEKYTLNVGPNTLGNWKRKPKQEQEQEHWNADTCHSTDK